MTTEKQTTIAKEASISGKGLHSGKQVTITLKPAPDHFGVQFRRVDLPQQPIVKACVSNVYDTSRGTSLRENGAEVKTVEHLLAALAGMQIDNVLVDIDAEETPILDGSSRFYVELLKKAGKKAQLADRQYLTVEKEIRFSKPEAGIELTISPSDTFDMEVEVDYGTQVLAAQKAALKNLTDFESEIYNCRTFVFLHEIQLLIEHNLVKGGDLDNAIVFVDKKPDAAVLDKLAAFFNKSDIQVNENGTLNNLQLRYPNEPARHKLLDLIGDLYLLGKPLKAKVLAKKPGHFANVEFAKLIAAQL